MCDSDGIEVVACCALCADHGSYGFLLCKTGLSDNVVKVLVFGRGLGKRLWRRTGKRSQLFLSRLKPYVSVSIFPLLREVFPVFCDQFVTQ
jgi:hypothetical protein